MRGSLPGILEGKSTFHIQGTASSGETPEWGKPQILCSEKRGEEPSKPSTNYRVSVLFWTGRPGIHSTLRITKLDFQQSVCSSLIHVRLCDPTDCSHQAPLSMGFSRQEYWSGLPCPPPGDLPNPGIEPRSPALQADSLLSEPRGELYCTPVQQ